MKIMCVSTVLVFFTYCQFLFLSKGAVKDGAYYEENISPTAAQHLPSKTQSSGEFCLFPVFLNTEMVCVSELNLIFFFFAD